VSGVSLPQIVGVVALVTAVVGIIAGLSGWWFYETELIGVDASTNLIIVSLLCPLIAIPVGFVGSRWAKKRRQEPLLSDSAIILGIGTLATWFVVFVYALGR
jgi:hypothetical protein